jgi:hypothetical protein
VRVPLVPAYKECTAPNSTHIGPLNRPSCNAAALESDLLTVSTTGKSSGYVRLGVIAGNPATPQNEADVTIRASMSDVRNRSDSTDYTGQVLVSAPIRITDKANGFSGAIPGTATDTLLGVPVDCVATTDTTIGSTCSINTTLGALVPDIVRESKRSIISALGVKVMDAGADGSLTPVPGPIACPPLCGSGDEHAFMTQGVFTP